MPIHRLIESRLLKELNPSVEGSAEERSLASVLRTDATWLDSFNLIILCGSGSADDVGPRVQKELKDLVWERGRVPVISFRTSGFVAMLRTQFKEHCGEFLVNPICENSQSLNSLSC